MNQKDFLGAARKLRATPVDNERNVTTTAMPFSQRPFCTIREACAATGLSRTFLYERIASGELASKTVGKRRLVDVPSLLGLVGSDAEVSK